MINHKPNMTRVAKAVDTKVLDSTEWLGTHTGPRFKSAGDCEKCFLGGMAFVIAQLNGTTQEQEYQAMLARVPKPKKRMIVSGGKATQPITKRVVVRRKK